MTLNEYQNAAMTTCMDTCNNLPYMLFNLQGEVGAFYASSHSHTNSGSRLAFKSEELASYAAKQFIDIYKDFVTL